MSRVILNLLPYKRSVRSKKIPVTASCYKTFHNGAPVPSARERKTIEIYSEPEVNAINKILSDGDFTKRDKAICLLLLETGLRAVDVCNIKLSDIDWIKDVIYIKQQKTGVVLNIPLQKPYGSVSNPNLLLSDESQFVQKLFHAWSQDFSSSVIQIVPSVLASCHPNVLWLLSLHITNEKTTFLLKPNRYTTQVYVLSEKFVSSYHIFQLIHLSAPTMQCLVCNNLPHVYTFILSWFCSFRHTPF